MHVTLNYFAQVRQAAGVEAEQVQLDDDTDVLGAVEEVAERHGKDLRGLVLDESGAIRPSLMVLVNGQSLSAGQSLALADGDEITILSPIAGG